MKPWAKSRSGDGRTDRSVRPQVTPMRVALLGLLAVAPVACTGCGLVLATGPSVSSATTVVTPAGGAGPAAPQNRPGVRTITPITPTTSAPDPMAQARAKSESLAKLQEVRNRSASADSNGICAAGDRAVLAGKDLFDMQGASVPDLREAEDRFIEAVSQALTLEPKLSSEERTKLLDQIPALRTAVAKSNSAGDASFVLKAFLTRNSEAVDRFLANLAKDCPQVTALSGATAGAIITELDNITPIGRKLPHA